MSTSVMQSSFLHCGTDQVQCCNPEINGGGGWGIFNSLLGWQNSATIGSVVSYNVYWIAVIAAFLAMGYREKKGHWPLTKAKARKEKLGGDESQDSRSGSEVACPEKAAVKAGSSEVQSLDCK